MNNPALNRPNWQHCCQPKLKTNLQAKCWFALWLNRNFNDTMRRMRNIFHLSLKIVKHELKIVAIFSIFFQREVIEEKLDCGIMLEAGFRYILRTEYTVRPCPNIYSLLWMENITSCL